MMMAYGFCLFDNVHDSYGLELTIRKPADDGSGACTAQSLGTFRLLRQDHPGVIAGDVAQIPVDLWRAISDPQEYVRVKASKAPNGANSEEAQAALDIGIEDVELLLHTVERRLSPFLLTREDDVKMAQLSSTKDNNVDMRDVFVARYRDGQRRVLESALHVLRSITDESEDADDNATESS